MDIAHQPCALRAIRTPNLKRATGSSAILRKKMAIDSSMPCEFLKSYQWISFFMMIGLSARSRDRMEHPKNSTATICITNLASINGGAYLHDSITTATILLMTWVEPSPGILSSYLSISTISDPGGWLSLSVWVPSSRIGRVSVTRMTTWPTNLCRGWRLTTNLESWERHATWGITLAKPAQ